MNFRYLKPCNLFFILIWMIAGSVQAAATKKPVTIATATAKGAVKQDTRLPIPPAADQTDGRQQIQQIFQSKFHVLNNHTIGPFMGYLWTHYSDAKAHPVRCYVAMKLQLQLATRATAANLVTQAAEQLDISYQVNGYALLVKSANVMIQNHYVTRGQEKLLQQQMLQASQQALTQEHYSSAKRLAQVSGIAARRLRDQGGMASAENFYRQAQGLAQLQAKYKQALITLKSNSKDAKANEAVGLFLLAAKDNITEAIPYLALSDNAKWQELSQLLRIKFLSYPQMLYIGDLFWDLGKNQSNPVAADAILKQADDNYHSGSLGINPTMLQMLTNGNYRQAVSLLTEAIRSDQRLVRNGYGWLHVNPIIWSAILAQIKTRRKRYESVMQQMSAGHTTPANREIVGEYLCFLEGRWKIGLAFLMDGYTPAIVRAARLDRAAPTAAEDQKIAGDAWWNIAKKYTSIEQYHLMERAIYWYQLAMPKLPVADQTIIKYRVLRFKPNEIP